MGEEAKSSAAVTPSDQPPSLVTSSFSQVVHGASSNMSLVAEVRRLIVNMVYLNEVLHRQLALT